jgi:predicted nuclease with TOPRIM domain
MENIIIAVITVLGSGVVWKYFENRAKERTSHGEWVKMDCQRRITKLEGLLREASEEKDELRQQVLTLSKQVAELVTKIKFLEKEKKAQ